MIIASPTLSWRMNSVKWPWTTVPLLVIRPTPCKIVICGGSSKDCRETSSVASRLLFVPDRLLDVPPDDEEVDDLTALGFSPLKESFPRTTLPYEDIFDLIYIFQQNICVPFSVNHKPTIKSLLTVLTDKQLELFALYAPLLSKRVLSKHFINRSASESIGSQRFHSITNFFGHILFWNIDSCQMRILLSLFLLLTVLACVVATADDADVLIADSKPVPIVGNNDPTTPIIQAQQKESSAKSSMENDVLEVESLRDEGDSSGPVFSESELKRWPVRVSNKLFPICCTNAVRR